MKDVKDVKGSYFHILLWNEYKLGMHGCEEMNNPERARDNK